MAAEGTPSLVLGGTVDDRRGEPRPGGGDRLYPTCAASAVNLPGNARGEGDIQWRPVSMVEMEMDAALVLANFAKIAFLERESSGDRGIAPPDAGSKKRAEFWPPRGDADSRADRQERDKSKQKTPSSCRAQRSRSRENPPIAEDSKSSETNEEPTFGCPSRKLLSPSGIRGKQDLTEDEKEAKRLRRVLANRESARQTIFRRQARYEELSRRATELSLENEQIKSEKVRLAEEYSSLRDTNVRLKDQIATLKDEIKEDHVMGISASVKTELPTCSSVIGSLTRINTIFPLLHSAELFSFHGGGGIRSLQSSGMLPPMFPWLFPVYYPPPPWPADSAPAMASCRGEVTIEQASLDSRGMENMSKDVARVSKSETGRVVNVKRESEDIELEGPCHRLEKLVDASTATEVQKKRKEMAKRGRRC